MSSLVGNHRTTNVVPSTSTISGQGLSSDLGATSSRIKKYSSLQQRLSRSRHGSGILTMANYLNTRHRASYANVNLAHIARNHPPFMNRLDEMKRLPIHDGCVNTLYWNKTGEYLLSGSDDCNLCITKPGYMFDSSQDYTVLHKVHTRHLGNIFSAQFVPNTGDKQIVSCSSEGPIIVHDINSTDPSEGLLNFNCHTETIFEVITVPDDDKVFLSCGEDKTIRLFDMRVHNSCARAGTCPHPALIRNSHAMTTLGLHPLNSNLMLVGRADGIGLVYDRRKLPDVTKFSREQAHADRMAGVPSQSYHFKHPLEGVVAQFSVPDMDDKYRFTSLCYNRDGSEVLASYSGDYIYLFSHDKSSNFELIQTLPKKVSGNSSSSGEDNGDSGDGYDGTQSNQSRNEAPGGASGGRLRSADTSRSARISRIRVRGDWSDTGVNSVPHSQRRQDIDDSDTESRRPSFLERVAVSLSAHRQRFVPITEIIAGPIEYGNNPSRQERTIEEEEEEEEDDEEDVGDDDEEDDEENEDEEGDNDGVCCDEHDDDGENSTLIDDDDTESRNGHLTSDDEMENFERFATITVENLMDEATEQAAHRAGNSESTYMDHDSDRRDKKSSSSTKDNCDAADKSGGRPKISPKTKEKFKRTIDELKSKYNNIPTFKPRIKYQGHRNSRTSIKEAIFWGDDYIMSGSDCGRIMVWEKKTAKIVMAFKADERVVNCLAPNPFNYVLASSGIDYDIKLWSTQSLKEEPLKISDDEMKKIVENNELMLEESKQTLSVPPHLFFRVLASLVQSSR